MLAIVSAFGREVHWITNRRQHHHCGRRRRLSSAVVDEGVTGPAATCGAARQLPPALDREVGPTDRPHHVERLAVYSQAIFATMCYDDAELPRCAPQGPASHPRSASSSYGPNSPTRTVRPRTPAPEPRLRRGVLGPPGAEVRSRRCRTLRADLLLFVSSLAGCVFAAFVGHLALGSPRCGEASAPRARP